VIIVTKQESFKPNEMKKARGRETPGFFLKFSVTINGNIRLYCDTKKKR